MNRSPTPCACGCGELAPAIGRRRFASDACRQRAHRKRQVRARRDVREAIASRGDLLSLLERAAQRARERPGSVLLRLDGGLHALEAGELARLVEQLGRGPGAAELAQQQAAPPARPTAPTAAIGRLRALVDRVEAARLAAHEHVDFWGLAPDKIDAMYAELEVRNHRTMEYFGDLRPADLAALLAAAAPPTPP